MLTGKLPRYFRESEVPEEFRLPISKALSHRRDERYESAKELTGDLKASDLIHSQLTASATTDSAVKASENWECPNCTNLNSMSTDYCVRCGTYGMQPCPVCEAVVRVGNQQCPNCGVDLKEAEEASILVTEAQRFADFMEFETALQCIKDLDNQQNPQVYNLSKEWRSVILQRRNLLTDLDSSLRVYNLNNAVDLHENLKKMIPEECLSDSLDFDVVVKFSTLESQLINLLKDSASRAQDDYDLDKFSLYINSLNDVCGNESCNTINSELTDINTSLDNMVTKAGLAIGMNCLSRGLDMLMTVAPWKGSELGDRRDRMVASCKDLLAEREEIIDNLEEAIRTDRYIDALGYLKETLRFCLPPNNSEMEPGDDDLATNDRITNVDKILFRKFEEKIPIWVKNENWEDIRNAFAAFRNEEKSNWKKLDEKLRNLVNKKIADCYNTAVEEEGKSHISEAEKDWELFLNIPQELIPAHLWQYAGDFKKRKKTFLQSQKNQLIKKVILFTFISWSMPVLLKLFPLIFSYYTTDKLSLSALKEFLPGFLNFSVFIICAGVIGSKKLVKAELQKDLDFASPRIHLLFFIVACSPISYIVYHIVDWSQSIKSLALPEFFPFLFVALFWLVVDVFRRYKWRITGLYCLTISWVLVSSVIALNKGFGMPGHSLWPCILLLHGIFYSIILLVQNIVMRGKATS